MAEDGWTQSYRDEQGGSAREDRDPLEISPGVMARGAVADELRPPDDEPAPAGGDPSSLTPPARPPAPTDPDGGAEGDTPEA